MAAARPNLLGGLVVGGWRSEGVRQEARKNSLPAQPGSGLMTLQLRHQI